jgi:hypothetical protein
MIKGIFDLYPRSSLPLTNKLALFLTLYCSYSIDHHIRGHDQVFTIKSIHFDEPEQET